jgi:enoyl-CoA hydratase/carnithine racemase
MKKLMSGNTDKPPLLREVTDGVCTLTLNRPDKRNALSSELLGELQRAFDNIASDKTIKVIILAGNGPIFSSGHDLKEMRKDSSYSAMHTLFNQCSNMMISMKKQPQPIIAKVYGSAMAAGCQLMCNCDLAIAAKTAKFALPGSSIGLFCSSPAVAVGRVANPKHTMEMLLMGETFNAEDAVRFGLINKAVSPEELDKTVMAYANKITKQSSMTISMGKNAFYKQIDMDLEAAYAFTSEIMAKNMQEHDAHEGIDAFLEKRDATWRGR